MASRTASALRETVWSVARADQAGATDRDLLRRFLDENDQSAFAALVGRHNGMVLGVCRRLLPTVQDAEDACQATFLVLAQKARSIRWQSSLANWLYTTARKVARNARVATERRTKRERRAAVSKSPEPVDRMTARELLTSLDAELEKLSPRYREPLVLCYLEGLTGDEAAARLGIPLATLHTRLNRGRKRLHDALTRGGCALGAGLLALAVTSPAGASPPRLVNAILSTVSGPVPEAVAALVKGVAVNGIAKHVGVILLAAVGIAALGLVSRNSPVVGQPPVKPTPADGPQAGDVKPTPDKPKPLTVAGQVLDPDGKPAAGAEVACGPATTTTQADGRFRLTVTPGDPRDALTVTATAKGLGPDWAVVKDAGRAGEVTLKLAADDVPFTGRVANLENQPLKGISVEVLRLGKEGRGAPEPVLTLNHKLKEARLREKMMRAGLNEDWFDDRDLIAVASRFVVAKTNTTTDADGKFTLTGFGRERMIEVRVHGPGVEMRRFWVVTRPGGPKDGLDKTGLHPPEGTILLSPSRPLVGTVRDAKSGKPVAGVTVSEVRSSAAASVTDKNGQYRIEGVKKQKSYFLSAVGSRSVPLFQTPAQEVVDTGGLGALETNLTVELGLGLTGRVIAQETGKPVAADVYYLPADDNSSVKNLPAERPRFTSGQTDRDGRFFLPAWPGKGALTVQIREDGPVPAVDAERLLNELNVSVLLTPPVQAVVAVNADASKPESLDISIPLEEGLVRKGTVLGPDDKSLTGAQAAGVIFGQFTDKLETPEFTPTPMRPGVKRLMIFFHAEKKLGAIQMVEGTSADPFTVKLQPLGSVTGAFLKGDKEPWAGLTVTAVPVEDDAGYENLPRENFRFQGEQCSRKVPWWDWTRRTAKTDENGSFRLDGLLPGRDYHVYVSDGDLGDKGTLVRQLKASAPPGKTLDLGVLTKGPPE